LLIGSEESLSHIFYPLHIHQPSSQTAGNEFLCEQFNEWTVERECTLALQKNSGRVLLQNIPSLSFSLNKKIVTNIASDRPFPFTVTHPARWTNNSYPLHSLVISRLINNAVKKDVIDIKKIGRNKITAEIKNLRVTNNFIDHSILRDKNFITFIPSFEVAYRHH